MTGHRDEALSHWLERRSASWASLENALKRRPAGSLEPREAMTLVDGLRQVGRDFSLAQSIAPGGRLAMYLRGLFLRLQATVYRPPRRPLRQAYETIRYEIPATCWAIRYRLAAVVALFIGSAGVGWALVERYPALASLFASEEMIASVQKGELWTEGMLNIVPSSLLALGVMMNNIVVSLTAFVLGSFYGLGTLYIIALNGLMLGGLFAFTGQHGLAGDLAEFVVAHGIVELSVICLAGAAGVGLGEALMRPGRQPRARAFNEAVRQGGSLVLVAALFLVGAGVIEGYVSPDSDYGLLARLAVGLGYFAMFALTISGALWRLPQAMAWLRRGG